MVKRKSMVEVITYQAPGTIALWKACIFSTKNDRTTKKVRAVGWMDRLLRVTVWEDRPQACLSCCWGHFRCTRKMPGNTLFLCVMPMSTRTLSALPQLSAYPWAHPGPAHHIIAKTGHFGLAKASFGLVIMLVLVQAGYESCQWVKRWSPSIVWFQAVASRWHVEEKGLLARALQWGESPQLKPTEKK